MPERRDRRYPKWLPQLLYISYLSSIVVPGPLFLVSYPASTWNNPNKGRPNITPEEARHIRLVEANRVLAVLVGAVAYTSGFSGYEVGAVVGSVNFALGLYVFAYYTNAVASK